MEKSVKITTIIVAGVLLIALMIYSFANSVTSNDVLRVQGSSTVEATPDLVTVYFEVETTGDTSAEAKDANSVIVEKLTSDIVALGFDKSDIITQSFNIYENCEWINRQNVCNGYKATHSIKVEMSTEESSKIGEVIDAGVNAGATVNYINFELSQELQNQYKAEAMKLAAEDARIKAEAVAEGLDKDVGKIVSVSVDNWNYYPWKVYDYAESVGSSVDDELATVTTRIQPGEREISASVSASFKIK